MIDELELLKQDWKKQEGSLPHLEAKDIYPMLLKKSSSIVKWIFVISIAEFLFWLVITFMPLDPETIKFMEEGHLKTFNTILLSIQFSGLAFFMVWFYKNYRKIQSTDSARVLMSNILNTRKTVKYYIWFNLTLFAISLIVVFSFLINHTPEKYADINHTYLIIASVGVSAVFIAFSGYFTVLFTEYSLDA